MACDKAIYPDKKAAVTARRGVSQSGRMREDELKAYWCDRCGGWHLTKREGADMRRTRKERAERKRKGSRRERYVNRREGLYE